MKTFEEIYKKRTLYFNYIKYRVGNYHDSEEMLNDLMLKVYKNLGTFNNAKAELNTWIFTIANNLIIDYWRKNKNKKTISISSFVNDDGEEYFQIEEKGNKKNNIENVQLSKIINETIDSLTDVYKKYAILFFIEEKNYNEISEILNVPLGTVKGMINRTRSILQNNLKCKEGVF